MEAWVKYLLIIPRPGVVLGAGTQRMSDLPSMLKSIYSLLQLTTGTHCTTGTVVQLLAEWLARAKYGDHWGTVVWEMD